jgi:hypothetical protein
MAKTANTNRRWWLESGHDTCESCSHTYVYETGYHCVECDAAICSICVVETISVNVICYQCNESVKAES